MTNVYKTTIVLFLLLLLLAGCSKSDDQNAYETMNSILESKESGFKSTINIGADSYFYEEDTVGNKHIIDKTGKEEVEMYLIGEKYYICTEKCEHLTKEVVTKIYKDKYSVAVLQTIIDNAFLYHEAQYEYIMSLKDNNKNPVISVDNVGTYTLLYDKNENERQIVIVNKSENEIKYNYNGTEENDVHFVLAPELTLDVMAE